MDVPVLDLRPLAPAVRHGLVYDALDGLAPGEVLELGQRPDANRREEGGDVTADHQSATTTEITIVGANCPWCLNETLDLLRAEPGVVLVESTMSGQCLRIEHEHVEVHNFLELIRRHLHAIGISAAETVMVEIDPRVAELRCPHRQAADAEADR